MGKGGWAAWAAVGGWLLVAGPAAAFVLLPPVALPPTESALLPTPTPKTNGAYRSMWDWTPAAGEAGSPLNPTPVPTPQPSATAGPQGAPPALPPPPAASPAAGAPPAAGSPSAAPGAAPSALPEPPVLPAPRLESSPSPTPRPLPVASIRPN